MSRFVFGVAVVLFAGGVLAADEPAKVTIKWHGQSFFEVESSKGTRVVIDPHAIEEYGRISVNADLVLISHLHNDHTQIGVVENRARAKVLQGVKVVGRKMEWNPIDEKFADVRVQTVGTYHDDVQGMERGKNAVFIVEMDGLRIVHLGDLGHVLTEAQVKAIGPVDVLMIPVGGVYTLNGTEAKKVVAQLKPRRYVIPMHCGTKVYDDLLPPDEFLEDQKNVKRLPGNKLVVETDFKPAAPVVAVLNWR